MSWSVSLIGNPDNIVKALEEESVRLEGTGNCKTEFDAALPNLIGLVKQNYGNPNAPFLKLVANGHGWASGELSYGSCYVSIEQLLGKLV